MYWDPDASATTHGRLFTAAPVDVAEAARTAGRWLVKAAIRPLVVLLSGI